MLKRIRREEKTVSSQVKVSFLDKVQYFCVEGWQCLINRANWLRSAAAAYCVHVFVYYRFEVSAILLLL